MKITKRQLRRIIKEEKAKLLKEATSYGQGVAQVYDADDGQRVVVSAKVEPFAGFISLVFGSSYRIALHPDDADAIMDLLDGAMREFADARKGAEETNPDNAESVDAFLDAVPGSERG